MRTCRVNGCESRRDERIGTRMNARAPSLINRRVNIFLLSSFPPREKFFFLLSPRLTLARDLSKQSIGKNWRYDAQGKGEGRRR